MRRAGGWILGVLIAAAMAGGGWIEFRPVLKRETIVIGHLKQGRDPSDDALASGMQFALQEAGGRAGRFRVDFVTLPSGSLGDSSVVVRTGDLAMIVASLADMTPLNDGAQRLHSFPLWKEVYQAGKAAAAWTREAGLTRIVLLLDLDYPFGQDIGEEFKRAAGNLFLVVEEHFKQKEDREACLEQVLSAKPDLVVYSGEEAPYGTAFELFDALRKKGYTGRLLMGDADPDVSFLAVPTRVIEGTMLVSMIGPPSKEFAAVYEPATGRHAGPHAWPGYLKMKEILDLLERADSSRQEDLRAALQAKPPVRCPCALYVSRNGKFEFAQDLK